MPDITVMGIPAIFLAFLSAMIITWYFIPRVIRIVNEHKLTDRPGHHKIHIGDVSSFGGIGIFAGFTVGFLVAVNGYISGISYFTAAVMLLFFVGLTDDLLRLQPRNKLLAEIFSVLLIVLFTDLRFTNLHGFLGVSGIPAWASYSISIFLIVVIINAVNLCDGIDGLAASIGIIASLAFGTWFFLAGDYGYTVVAASLLGALVVFLSFNLSDGANKIFMGDSGSLIIGFTLAVFAIHFNELNLTDKPVHHLNSSPSVTIAILIIPLFDTLRVMILRIRSNQSPFVGDNRHVHHMMLRAGFSHISATLIISVFNIFLIGIALLLDHVGILYLGLILLILCIGFVGVIMVMVRRREGLAVRSEA